MLVKKIMIRENCKHPFCLNNWCFETYGTEYVGYNKPLAWRSKYLIFGVGKWADELNFIDFGARKWAVIDFCCWKMSWRADECQQDKFCWFFYWF